MAEAPASMWQPILTGVRGASPPLDSRKRAFAFGCVHRVSAVYKWLAGLCLLLGACGQNAPPDACPAAAPTDCASSPLGYAADIAPILNQRCAPCHSSTGDEKQVPLTDYDAVSHERTGITTQVSSCSMPPPALAPGLTPEERQQVLAWLACDARP